MRFMVLVALYLFSLHCVYGDDEGSSGDADGSEHSFELDHLSILLERLEQHLRTVQKRTCRLGIHSHTCALIDLDELKKAQEYLRSGESPGKRDSVLGYEMTADELKTAVEKRDCRFRLGGHCLTEALDRAADKYYYLKSPDSPGRRRRALSVPNWRPTWLQ